jgi:membrane-associated phospholipid phosphatase
VPLLVLVLVSLAAAAAQALWASRYGRRLAPNVVATSAPGMPTVARSGSSIGRWLAACRHPAAATALALCVAVVVSVLGWLLVGVLAFLVRAQGALLELDSGVADWGSTHATKVSTAALEGITPLGDTRVVIGMAALLLIAEAVRGLEMRAVVFLAAVMVGNKLITTAVKDLVDRARPALNPIAETLGPSFPSGHSSTAAAFYTAAAVILARRHGRAGFTALTSLAAGIAVAVACTRVLLDVHWLSDVVAGLALGWAWVTLCVVVLGDQLLTAGRPVSRRLGYRHPQSSDDTPNADVDSAAART